MANVVWLTTCYGPRVPNAKTLLDPGTNLFAPGTIGPHASEHYRKRLGISQRLPISSADSAECGRNRTPKVCAIVFAAACLLACGCVDV